MTPSIRDFAELIVKELDQLSHENLKLREAYDDLTYKNAILESRINDLSQSVETLYEALSTKHTCNCNNEFKPDNEIKEMFKNKSVDPKHVHEKVSLPHYKSIKELFKQQGYSLDTSIPNKVIIYKLE